MPEEDAMIDDNVFREEVRNLKTMIRGDPAVLARYDVDGNGEIDGAARRLHRSLRAAHGRGLTCLPTRRS